MFGIHVGRHLQAERFEDKLTATQTQVTELVQSIEFACAQARDATTTATTVQAEVSKLKSELNLLKCENNKLTNDLLFVKQGLTKQEAYSRRLNLKPGGLPEEPNESVEQTTRKVLRHRHKRDSTGGNPKNRYYAIPPLP